MEAMVAPGASDISPLLAGVVRLRVASGVVTESALAAVVGCTQCTVSNWVRGRKRLGVRLCDAVMCELGLTVAEVLASVAAPLVVAHPRGVLLVMPGGAAWIRPRWRLTSSAGGVRREGAGRGLRRHRRGRARGVGRVRGESVGVAWCG
jgi:hypothetical protein